MQRILNPWSKCSNPTSHVMVPQTLFSGIQEISSTIKFTRVSEEPQRGSHIFTVFLRKSV
ncbi:hypothetical protein KKF34_09000 [Myxococcota bacterium]|nr:hypothetical protein [Myxococcota bacterium]MBU1496999.1 hypothetical protein [Myxococcota bacterium]